jgi:hypothetical protein
MFDAPVAQPWPLFPPPSGSGPLADRARAYLHANCSMCHRPGGTTQATIDLRFGTPLSDTAACNAAPVDGDLGVSGAKILTPGMPSLSLLSARMHESTAMSGRMPPLATIVVDMMGVGTVDGWIMGLAGCP